ncbi:MAG: amidohydrolase family protein [Eubacteriales bacterium]|nr:amidohydrolase family protein [Eubacteriales bacterium]
MSTLLEIKPSDILFYEENIKEFLPMKFVDIHTHVWLDRFMKKENLAESRAVTWPSLVAKDNSVEDLLETYELMFPGKTVTPLIFPSSDINIDFNAANRYVKECSVKYDLPSLLLSVPNWNETEFESRLRDGCFLGAKVYLSFAPSYIPADEIRIFDFIPHTQLNVLDRLGLILMLHIPRSKRLRDPVNLAQMLEIENKYPGITLIIAHVGRAYCEEDIGNAFEVLSKTEKMLFDFSANTNQYVFEKLIDSVGPKRILFGSDMPILRMRSKRVCENGHYVNIVPGNLYGDVSNDMNMREAYGEEAESITFFMYEEINAFRKATRSCGLNKYDVDDIFNNNSIRIINNARRAYK